MRTFQTGLRYQWTAPHPHVHEHHDALPGIDQLIVESKSLPRGKPLLPELPNFAGTAIDPVEVQHGRVCGVQLDLRIPDLRQSRDRSFRTGTGGELSE